LDITAEHEPLKASLPERDRVGDEKEQKDPAVVLYLVIAAQSRMSISHVAVSNDAGGDRGCTAVARCRGFDVDERLIALISGGRTRDRDRRLSTGARKDRLIDSHGRRRLTDRLDGSRTGLLQGDSDHCRRRLVVGTRRIVTTSFVDAAAVRVDEIHVVDRRWLVQCSLHLGAQLLQMFEKNESSTAWPQGRVTTNSGQDLRRTIDAEKINSSLTVHKSVTNSGYRNLERCRTADNILTGLTGSHLVPGVRMQVQKPNSGREHIYGAVLMEKLSAGGR